MTDQGLAPISDRPEPGQDTKARFPDSPKRAKAPESKTKTQEAHAIESLMMLERARNAVLDSLDPVAASRVEMRVMDIVNAGKLSATMSKDLKTRTDQTVLPPLRRRAPGKRLPKTSNWQRTEDLILQVLRRHCRDTSTDQKAVVALPFDETRELLRAAGMGNAVKSDRTMFDLLLAAARDGSAPRKKNALKLWNHGVGATVIDGQEVWTYRPEADLGRSKTTP